MPPRPQPPILPPDSHPQRALGVLLADGKPRNALRALAADPQAKLYAGLGLAGRALSDGLAIDVLSLLALVEHLRRATAGSKATVLIADTNAIAAGYPAALVQELAADYLRQCRALCEQMNAQIELQLASKWDALAEPIVLPRAAQRTAPYVRVQLEQMVALFAQGYRIKVGWRMPGAKRDEQHFDTLYREILEAQDSEHCLQTIYGLAGRSFDPCHPRACPYISYLDTPRVLLSSQTSVREQFRTALRLQPNPARGYRRHLIKLARGLRPLLSKPMATLPALDLLESFKCAARDTK